MLDVMRSGILMGDLCIFLNLILTKIIQNEKQFID